MASQVLSGTGSVSYTNNTGQNVRVIINYLASVGDESFQASNINMSWGNGAAMDSRFPNSENFIGIGRNLAFTQNNPPRGSTGPGLAGNNMSSFYTAALPTELMLAPGQTFSASSSEGYIIAYNIVIIPENG